MKAKGHFYALNRQWFLQHSMLNPLECPLRYLNFSKYSATRILDFRFRI